MEFVDAAVKEHAGITFVEADISSPEAALPEELLRACPRPWVVFEDCHVATVQLWTHLDRHMQVGDYFVIEDMHPYTNADTATREFEFQTVDTC